MRKCTTAVAVASLAAVLVSPAIAEPMLGEGTKELTLQGFVDFEDRDDYFVYANIGYGYFVKDGLEIGGNLGINASKSSQNFTLGPFVEYNFVQDSNLVPYLHLGMSWVYSDVEFGTGSDLISDSGSELLLDAEAGLKYFLRDNIAISTGLAYEWASADIFEADNTLEDGNALLKLGMRFYL